MRMGRAGVCGAVLLMGLGGAWGWAQGQGNGQANPQANTQANQENKTPASTPTNPQTNTPANGQSSPNANPQTTGQANTQANGQVPTIEVTSRLVFLDVTVVDKKGRPVTTGLTKDDFTITENREPQKIFSFEAPEVHTLRGRSAENANGEAPVTIIVLDELDSSFEDFAYYRYKVQRYLEAEPSRLRSPAEMMVVGNESLELVQGFTRNREDLVEALKHLPPVLPYKQMNGAFWAERFTQSMRALQEIALDNRGVPGRKNILWMGRGGPAINTSGWPAGVQEEVLAYVHATTNLLVDARATLFVIYPGLSAGAGVGGLSAMDAGIDLGDNDDPFAGDINFGVFVDETGGKLFYNRNDLDGLMREAERLGSEYYTLTYQPHNSDDNGRFERIRVTLRDPNLRALTKAGYFAPDAKSKVSPEQRAMWNLAAAVQSRVPFDALGVSIGGVVRHPDARAVELRVVIQPKDLEWLADSDGKNSLDLVLAAASMNGRRDILASRMQHWRLESPMSLEQLKTKALAMKVTLRVPKRTASVRVVVQATAGERMGTAEVTRKTIDAAPAEPTPQPQLTTGSR